MVVIKASEFCLSLYQWLSQVVFSIALFICLFVYLAGSRACLFLGQICLWAVSPCGRLHSALFVLCLLYKIPTWNSFFVLRLSTIQDSLVWLWCTSKHRAGLYLQPMYKLGLFCLAGRDILCCNGSPTPLPPSQLSWGRNACRSKVPSVALRFSML